MSVPRFSVNNPIAANLLMILLLGGGTYFALTQPRELFPQIEPIAVSINVPYPGSTPSELERGMVIKIEEAIYDLRNVERVTSNIMEGAANILVEFDSGTDVNQAVNDIKAEIDRLQNLPEEAEQIEISKLEIMLPVISIVVFGDTTERNLKAIAEQLRDELLETGEVTEASVSGVREAEISINVDPAKLERFNLTFQEVARQIGSHNIDIPAGDLKAAAGNIRVRTLGEERDVHTLEEIIIRAEPGGQVVRVKDVATVVDGFKETILRGRHNGKPAANVTVSKTSDQDAIRIARAVKEFVASRQSQFGGDVMLDVRDDTTQFIEQRLALLSRNAIFGWILVCLSLTLFLNFRVAFWAAIGVPVALLGSFVVMKFIGYTTNMITIFGLIVILGMVVDDAIVLGENMYRRFQEGLSPREAAIQGAEEVSLPVLATIMTTIAAFLPLAFIDDEVGEMFRPIAGVVIIALLVSLLEAFIILPSHIFGSLNKMKPASVEASKPVQHGDSADSAGATVLAKFAADSPKGWVRRFTEKKEYLLDVRLRDAYVKVLSTVVNWRYVSVTVALTLLMVVVAMIRNDRPPMVMMQEMDSDILTASIEMAAGTPVERTIEALEIVEQACLSVPEIRSVFSLVGQQIMIMPMASMGGRNADPATVGQILIELQPAEQRTRDSEQVLADIRANIRVIPNLASLKLEALDMGPPGADFEIQVRGDDLAVLARAVQYVKDKLSEFEGIEDIRDDLKAGKLEAQVRLSPVGRIAGVTVRDMAMQLRSAFFGAEAQTLQRGREEVEVRVRLQKDARDGLGDLDR
ncbi:efflux RND transporter permease subunit, partial [Candidatus Sumerlaeota bacterium]|nr:efflux RND transporter permease subunit [Candidatus Sumerlaeota bacterium]